MGLLSIIKKQKREDKELRVLILGLDSAGKTTIVRRLLGGDVNEVAPTMGFQISTLIKDGFTLNIWDVGGQTSIRPFWYNYFDRTDSIIWVVDSNSLERLDENFQEFRSILKEDRLTGASLLILANKIDLLEGDSSKIYKTVELIKSTLRLQTIANHHWNILPVSALTGENVDQSLEWIIKEAKERMYVL